MPRKGTKDHPKQYGRKKKHPQPPNRWELAKSKSFTSTSAQKILQSGKLGSYELSVNKTAETDDGGASTSAKKLRDPTMTDKANSSPFVAASGESVPAPVAAPKKAAAKSSKSRAKPAHPKTADMVTTAIVVLKERNGSSLQAIKKYMAGKYKIDTEKQSTFIKKYLKAAVASGTLVQTKGKGAAGSFKLGKAEAVKPKAKPAATVKTPKKVAVAKIPAAVKKPATATVRKASPKKPAASPVSPKKKAASIAPAAKPPKPKTTKAKPAQKSPAKKSKPSTAKKTKPVAGKAKKVAPKKTTTAKK